MSSPTSPRVSITLLTTYYPSTSSSTLLQPRQLLYDVASYCAATLLLWIHRPEPIAISTEFAAASLWSFTSTDHLCDSGRPCWLFSSLTGWNIIRCWILLLVLMMLCSTRVLLIVLLVTLYCCSVLYYWWCSLPMVIIFADFWTSLLLIYLLVCSFHCSLCVCVYYTLQQKWASTIV